jgi:hypothetical protein
MPENDKKGHGFYGSSRKIENIRDTSLLPKEKCLKNNQIELIQQIKPI